MPVRPERAPHLDKLPHRIARPVQAHGMDHQIMRAGLQRQRVVIRNHPRPRKPVLPEIGMTGHDDRRRKGFVNLGQAILDLIGGGLVQKQRRRDTGARPVASKGGAICQTCLAHERDTRMRASAFQTAVRLVYPPRCISCGGLVESDFGLCGPCWRDTPLISGLVCDACGTQLPGAAGPQVDYCDDCLVTARPWSRGRSALRYHDNARRLVLALKHGDRQDLARPAAAWMARAAQPLLRPDTLIAPVPLHWLRMLSRRFNQAALLAQGVARETGLDWCPDLLIRRSEERRVGKEC